MKRRLFSKAIQQFCIGVALVTSLLGMTNSALAQNADNEAITPPNEGYLILPENRGAFNRFKFRSEQSRESVFPQRGKSSKKSPARVSEAQQGPRILGSVVASMAGLPVGLYQIPVTSGQSFSQLIEEPNANGGGFLNDNVYTSTFFFTVFDYYIYVMVEEWDLDTGELLSSRFASTFTILGTDVAKDPTSGKVYGCYYTEDGLGFQLGIGNYETMSSTAICALPDAWNACAINSKGQLYAIDYEGRLLKVEKTNGNYEVVGTLPIKPTYSASAAFDLTDDTLYWTVINEAGDAGLYKIDTSNAQATLVNAFTGTQQVCGLVVPPIEAMPKAPAAVENLSLEFDADNLNGFVSFKSPNTSYDGTALSGTVNYNVTANGQTIATGATSYGIDNKVAVAVSEAGSYKFGVYLTNAEGDGAKKYIKSYIGNDTPAAPKVNIAYEDGKFNVTWAPVVNSVNGGYIDPQRISYTVTRMPDNVIVAQSTSATSLIDPVEKPISFITYHYEVTATYKEKTSQPGISNEVTIGVIVPPYLQTFDTQQQFNLFDVINANGDGETWYWWTTRKRAHIMYNSSMAMDDWLITPAIMLKGGMAYPLNFNTYSSGDYTERLEVKLGTAPSVEAMTTELLAPFSVTEKDATNHTCYIEVENDGMYYIGFHAISPKDTDYIDVDDISIGEGVAVHAPEAVSDLIVEADELGNKVVAISFVTPTKDYSNESITMLQSAQIYRNDELVHTERFPMPGQKIVWADTPSAPGYYTYTIYAVNGTGRGKPAFKKVFVGTNKTQAPENVAIFEKGNTGEVTVSWKAPEKDIDGNPARLTYVTYSILEGDKVIAEGLPAGEYSFVANDGDTQKFVQYGVTAVTESGNSPIALTPKLPVGKPYPAPFNESFANGEAGSILNMELLSGLNPVYWELCKDNDIPNLESQDGDNGYLAFTTESSGYASMVATGKIDLTGLTYPGLTFYSNPLGVGDLNTNTIDVYVDDGQYYYTMKNVAMNTLLNEGWNKVTVPLDYFKGKTVRFMFVAVNSFNIFTVMDNITVDELSELNLSAYNISGPLNVVPGKVFDISAVVQNTGAKSSGAFTLALLHNGDEIDRKAVSSIKAGEETKVVFSQSLGILSDEENEYRVKIISSADRDESDDISEILTVNLNLPVYPNVTDLSGQVEDTAVRLSWSEPNLDYEAPTAETDDFESYTSWATSGVGDWTFVDADGDYIGGLQNISLPGITGRQSFFVLDSTLPALYDNDTFKASSGKKYLANMFTGKVVDDWAITPRLSGEAQTVTFMARSYHEDYPETFQILYSTTDVKTSSFTLLSTHNNLPNSWEKFTVNLPEGARYMAIRCISDNAFMLFIDDVTFIKASPCEDLNLQYYRVYHNGEVLQNVSTPGYVYNPGDGEHEYAVTVVYDKGESRGSNIVTLNTSGSDIILKESPVIYAVGNKIIIKNAEGKAAAIYSIDGISIWRDDNVDSEHIEIEAAAGIYLGKVGDKEYKLLVR